MTKEEFLNDFWFNFPIPRGTAHTLEYAPRNDGSVEAIQRITLNNAGGLNELEMRFQLSREVITQNNYVFIPEDAMSISDIHDEYNREFPLDGIFG